MLAIFNVVLSWESMAYSVEDIEPRVQCYFGNYISGAERTMSSSALQLNSIARGEGIVFIIFYH